MELSQRKSPLQKKVDERCFSLLFTMDQVIIQTWGIWFLIYWILMSFVFLFFWSKQYSEENLENHFYYYIFLTPFRAIKYKYYVIYCRRFTIFSCFLNFNSKNLSLFFWIKLRIKFWGESHRHLEIWQTKRWK